MESFVYLGSPINVIRQPAKGGSAEYQQDKTRRKCIGHQEAADDGSGSRIWKSRGMSLGLQLRFLKTTAFPIAIYGCETWTMLSSDKKRVDAFEL